MMIQAFNIPGTAIRLVSLPMMDCIQVSCLGASRLKRPGIEMQRARIM